jgi:hypothetical protein
MEIDTPENIEKYWNGKTNYFIRLWMYCLRGLDVFNQWRYILMSIFALYYILHLKHIALLVGIFVICIPILCVFGWIQTHKIAKVIDWLNIKFSTHYSMYQINLQERIAKAVEKIAEEKKGNSSGLL